jgi:hypothetical protein
MAAVTLDEFFAPFPASRQIFDALLSAVESVGPAQVSVGRSQVAFRRRKAFAWAWIPARYLRGRTAPLVLTLSFPNRDPSPRWKEIVQPAPGRITHHLEVWTESDIDAEVIRWLQEAWAAGG